MSKNDDERDYVARVESRIVVGTSSALVAGVASRWRQQYGENPLPDKGSVQKQLDALDPATATAEEVVGIIGNDSWTTEMCDVCNVRSDVWVRLGDDFTDANVCPRCLAAASALVTRARSALPGSSGSSGGGER